MKNTDALELLARVRPVDPPPFLFTRIKARLDERRTRMAPSGWIAVALASAVVLVLLNVLALRNATREHGPSASPELLQEYGITTSNQLYR